MKRFNDTLGRTCYFIGMSLLFTLLFCCMPLLGASRQGPQMVIVCDDSVMDLYLAELYMRDYDVVVTTEKKANDGLMRIEQEHYDYAFVDWQLDTMTAMDFIKQAVPKNVWVKWYVMSDFWMSIGSGTVMRDLWMLGAVAILKSSVRDTDNVPLKSFRETLNFILNPKPL